MSFKDWLLSRLKECPKCGNKSMIHRTMGYWRCLECGFVN